MEIERLVTMANQIGDYFAAYPDRREAVRGIATHLRNFWDPRMRWQIIDHNNRGGGEGLKYVVREAIALLASEAASAPQTR